MATNAEINEKFYKATGNTWDVASLLEAEKITKEKLAWMIPDGAMLEDPEGRRYKESKDFMDALEIDMSEKSTVEPVTNEETTEVVPDTVVVEGVTYYKEQPATPTTEPDAGKEWTLVTTISGTTTYYAWVQNDIVVDIPDSIEVEGVTYYKEQPDMPTTEPDEGKEWTLDTTTSGTTTYYAWVQTTITEQPEEQNP